MFNFNKKKIQKLQEKIFWLAERRTEECEADAEWRKQYITQATKVVAERDELAKEVSIDQLKDLIKFAKDNHIDSLEYKGIKINISLHILPEDPETKEKGE